LWLGFLRKWFSIICLAMLGSAPVWKVQKPLWKQKKTGLGRCWVTLDRTIALRHQNTLVKGFLM